MRNVLAWLVMSVAVMSISVSACDEVDAAFDCQEVCSRYKECYDANYNVGQCRETCRANADADEAKRKKADMCETCIDGMSCTGAAFSCTTECAGIIAAGN